MKTIIDLKKTIWMVSLLALSFNLNAQAQEICTSFESGSNEGWVNLNVFSSISSPALDGSNYLRIRDASGSSYVYNPSAYSGSWEGFEGDCLCFDYKVFNDGNFGVSNLHPVIYIYQGTSPVSNTLSARFIGNVTITENSDWVHVCAPVSFNNGVDMPSNFEGQWQMLNGTPADWNTLLSNVSGVAFNGDVGGSMFQTEVSGIDNICLQQCDNDPPPTEEGAYCCDESENLVTNGNFEFGDTGFSSAYTQTANTPPGVYDVTPTAANFGATVTDHSFCEDAASYPTNDLFMVVNGKTQQAGSSVVWAQSVTGLEEGREYKFCANFKDMEQCTFNILPEITLNAGSNSITETINTDDTDPCDWQRVEICFIANGPSIDLRITLNETGNGDGNDLAIDDIALQAKLDPNYFITVEHQGSNNEILGSLNTVSPADDLLLNGDCEFNNGIDSFYWFVYEPIDPTAPLLSSITPSTFAWGNDNGCFGSVSSSTAWNLTTNFPNYTTFDDNRFYIIGMYVPSCCESCYTESWEYQITYNNGFAPVQARGFSNEVKNEIKKRFVRSQNDISIQDKELINEDRKLVLSPNPAQNNVVVSLLGDTIKSIEVLSLSGQVVYSDEPNVETSENLVGIESLASGLYLIRVTSHNAKQYASKLLKQ